MDDRTDHHPLPALLDDAAEFGLMRYPMHFFAAIQRQNFINVQAALRRHDVSPTEWRILAILFERNELSINTLSAITVTERSKTSRHVAAMEKKGLLTRAEGQKDRRSSSVALSKRGIDAYLAVLPRMKQVYARNFDGLSVEEFDLLMKLLVRIKDNVNRTEDFVGIGS